jgi:hypothetical protein
MKTTPRRHRSDSAAAAIAATQSAALGPLNPPEHVTLRTGDRPFWNAIVTARPRDTWTQADLTLAANLARTQADIETIQGQLDTDGYLIDGKANPLAAIIETLSRRAVTLSRTLLVHSQATVGRSEDIAKGAALERKARTEDDDDLIPHLRAVN